MENIPQNKVNLAYDLMERDLVHLSEIASATTSRSTKELTKQELIIAEHQISECIRLAGELVRKLSTARKKAVIAIKVCTAESHKTELKNDSDGSKLNKDKAKLLDSLKPKGTQTSMRA
jgi:hypothetical protein